MSQKKKALRDKSNDMAIFKQEQLPTYGLDENHERRISCSPLKYRPQINWDGFTDIR